MSEAEVEESAGDAREASARARDQSVQWKMFFGIGVFIAVLAVVYWFSSYEDAGTTMLALASGLALFFGSYLWVGDHRRRLGLVPSQAHAAAAAEAEAEADGEVVDESHYLPAASVWPLAMGAGAAMTLNGLIIGWPYATPGAALLALGVVGFVAQGRRRG